MSARVLMLAPPFFGYHEDVAAEMRRRGVEVDRMDDRPSDGVAFKSLARVSYGLVQPLVDRHLEAVLDRVRSVRYDAVFALGGMSWCFDLGQTERLKEESGARLTLYLWDSAENCQRAGAAARAFDSVLSFDPLDCERHGFEFLPLFYAFEPPVFPPRAPYEYDACFVGSVHQVSKFLRVKSIVDRLEAEGARVLKHYYVPSRSAAALRRAQVPEYRGVELTTRPLSRAETLAAYARSRALVDSPQAGQRGLTIRTIESVGMNRRLVTANAGVRAYDFFASGNVVVDDGSPDLSSAIADPAPYPDEVRAAYSVRSWVGRVLEAMGVS